MQLGLFGVNMDAWLDPEAAVRLASLVEAAGFDSLWAGEHVVLPSPRVPPSPMDPDDPILDPLLALAHLAAVTSRVRLVTGIVILPQRNPVVLAKEVASLDVLSGGRFTLGIGAGYVEPEMTAIGVPLSERGRRTDEYLAAMRALWEMESPVFEGRFARFSGVDAYPRPAQRPLPIVVGGHSPAAYDRTARDADGWYGFNQDPAAIHRSVDAIAEAVARVDRRPGLPPRVEISVTPPGVPTPDDIAAYAEAGVDHLVLYPPRHLDEEGMRGYIEMAAVLVRR